MKKKILAVVMTVAMLFCASTAFGLLDDKSVLKDSNNALAGAVGIGGDQQQQMGQIGINDQQQGQIGINKNKNIYSPDNKNVQGDVTGIQGQLGVVGQGNKQGTIVDASEKNDIFAPVFVAPSLNPVKGMNEAQINSILGGIGFSQTEEYSTCSESIKLTLDALKAGLITVDEAKEEYLIAKSQFEDATAPKRILSIGPKTRGRHIFNLFGMIATDACDLNVDNNLGFSK